MEDGTSGDDFAAAERADSASPGEDGAHTGSLPSPFYALFIGAQNLRIWPSLLFVVAIVFSGAPTIVYVLAIIGLALWWFWR